MHEWVLLSVEFEWKAARVTISFDTDQAGVVRIVAEGVTELHVPRGSPWGPSIHVNEVHQIPGRSPKTRELQIEMQSGDVIAITARSFALPDLAREMPVPSQMTAQEQ